jgi:hypothetical protein
MGRQMFAQGGHAYPMQDGGAMHQMPDGSMMPDSAMPPPQGPAPAMPGMPPADMANVDINQAAQGAIQQGIDPTVLEEMLGNYASQMEDLDDAEDYETVMNGVRGDRVPVEGRYAELAEVVGPEDARATPESVLTLLQPVMMLAAVDQGIGGLAQEEMSAPIEGAMAEGIMSTVNMGAPEAPVQVPGGPAPVNFNQGGAVQYMAPGGVALPDPRLQTLFDQQRALTRSIYGEADQEAALEEQTELTKAQMLFDVAQGALAFASPGDRQMSGAERLAQSFSPVLGNIGARAGELGKFKQAQKDRSLNLDLSNLQTAQASLQSEKAMAAAAANIKPGDSYQITDAEGKVLWQGPVGTVGRQAALMAKYPSAVNFVKVKEQKASSFVTFINPDDPTDFHVFDANNLSTANVSAMEAVRQSVNAAGKPLYRITGNYTPKPDSGTGASITNFRHPKTGHVIPIDLSTAAGKAEWLRIKDLGYVKAGVSGLDGASGTGASITNFRHPKTGHVIPIDLSTADGKAEWLRIKDLGYVKAGVSGLDGAGSVPNIQTVVNLNNSRDIRRFDLNDPTQKAEFDALDESTYVAITVPSINDLPTLGVDLGGSMEAKALNLISNADVLAAYGNNTLDQSTANIIDNYLTNELRAKPAWDPVTMRNVLVPGRTVGTAVMNAINARSKIEGASQPVIGVQGPLDEDVDGRIKRIPFKADGTPDFSSFKDEPLFIITGIDLTKSQGLASTVNRFFNLLLGQVKDVTNLGSGYAGNSGEITSQADAQLDTLARNIMAAARSGVDGRVFALEIKLLEEEVNGFKSGGGKTDNAARDQLVVVRNNLAMMYSQAGAKLLFSRTEKESTKIRGLQESVGQLIAETTAAIAVYDRFITTDPIDDAVTDRSSRSVTSGLSRASDGVPE